ncbi:hypothetical protein Tco_1366642 [Tanacetum coccineum]
MPTDPHHTPTIIESSTQPQKTQKHRKPKRKDTQVPQPSGPTDIVADKAVHKELGGSLVRAATTASSLEAEQDSGNITKTRSKATPNESSSLGTTSGGGPRCQETMGDTIAQTRFENVSKLSNDPLLARGKDASKQGRRINAINDDEDITLVNVQDDAEMFDVNTLASDEVFAEQEVAAKDVNLTIDEVTLAQALAALKSLKPKVKEPEPVKPTKKKVQIMLDEEIALILQAEIDEEERIARAEEEKIDKANIAWDDVQTKVDADYQLAERLQAEEQEQFIIEEKATLFKELLEQRRKHFAAKRAEEKRNKPPTKTQQKKTMITYLKNMEGWKHKDLKSKDFDYIKELFNKAFKRVDDVQETAEVDDDQEAAKCKELMEIVPDEEEVAIDAIPLATKPLTIIDWKIHKEGKKNYYQIIRADGSSNMYLVFSHMLKSFDREDFETLWKLVKAKYGSTRPVEGLDLIL